MPHISTLMNALGTIQQSIDDVNLFVEELRQQVDGLGARLNGSEYDGWRVSQCELGLGADLELYGDLSLQAPIEGTNCHIEMRFDDWIGQVDHDDLDPDDHSLQSDLPTPVLRYADGSLGWTPGKPLMGEQSIEAISKYAPRLERAHEALCRFFPYDPRPVWYRFGPAPFDIRAVKGSRSTDYLAAVTVRDGNVWQLNAVDEIKPELREQAKAPSPDIARDLGIRATSAVLPSHPGVASATPGSPEADDSRLREFLTTNTSDRTAYPFGSFVTSDPEVGVAFLHDLVNEYDRLLGEQTKDKS